MIRFFPSKEETRLIDINIHQLQTILKKYIKPVEKGSHGNASREYLFNGVWNEEEFSISLKLKMSNNFIPIIYGKYMDSEAGTLIKLRYQLFPATKRLLMFWTILTLLITLFFVGIYHAWLYGAISFGFCLVNYILSVENFKAQLKKSKRMLDKMLS
jgi:hypothetical protein